MRVRIGDSEGPRFDRITKGSLHVDAKGRVRYRGERGSTTFDVVDNVIQPPARPPAIAQ